MNLRNTARETILFVGIILFFGLAIYVLEQISEQVNKVSPSTEKNNDSILTTLKTMLLWAVDIAAPDPFEMMLKLLIRLGGLAVFAAAGKVICDFVFPSGGA